jgi:hypothetical protein
MQSKRYSGRWTLLLSLTAVLVSACATTPTGSSYKVQVPVLTARPLAVPCTDKTGSHTCIVLLQDDYARIVRELKAACLANRQSVAECQASPVQ